MAAALAIDVPPDPRSQPLDGPSATMATVGESFAKPSSPRPIPSPVSIPSRFDGNDVNSAACPAGSSQNPQASPRYHVPPPPIPDFVFPARPSTSAPSSYSRATGRRPKSVADLQERGNSLSPGSSATTAVRTSRSPALPEFSFNPGASLPPTPGHAFLSPPQSPQSPRAIPIRPGGGGHRRGGSEFVGGSIRSGEAFTFMSTSPTKSESGIASPMLSPQNSPPGPPSGPNAGKPAAPPHGRRGHVHRRSAAISSHDLSTILQPTNPSPPARGNSAPSSPSGFNQPDNKSYTFPDMSAVVSEASSPLPTKGEELPCTTAAEDVSTPEEKPAPKLIEEDQLRYSYTAKSTARARVGFSDTLEFIPRPLSLISSDTSSTVTARPPTGSGNHSVSGSISSIISLNASIPAGFERDGISPLVRSPSRSTVTESRPSTAGAVLDRTQSITVDDVDGASPRRRNSIPYLSSFPAPNADAPAYEATTVTQALPSPNKTPKRWSFFSLDPFIGNASANSPTRPSSCSNSPVLADSSSVIAIENTSIGAVPTPASHISHGAVESATPAVLSVDINHSSPAKTVTRKSSNNKKKKKVKSWGILTRKSKPRRKSRRAPTPPPMVPAADSDDESFEAQPGSSLAIDDATDGLTAPPMVFVTPSGSPSEPRDTSSAWGSLPSPALSAPDEDASLGMIDLDAALGPFNTPLPRNAEWEAAQLAGGLSKRQLHSAAGMTRFSGPGMHYSHRRAESAPEMPPFNRAGIPRFSSSSAMADVFEEDEEDDAKLATQNISINAPHQKRRSTSKPTSIYSASSASSSSPRQTSEFLQERPPSINIRVTSTDGAERASYDGGDFSTTNSDDAASSVALSRRGSGLSGLSDDDKTQPSTGLKSEYSASSLHDDVIVEEEDGNGFSFDDDGYEFAVESSSDSTIHSPGRLMKGKDLAPVDISPLHLPTTNALAPISPFSMSMATSSAAPSPRTPMSYDANRISTAPSSVTEDNFQSLLLGEPGPEVRISSDIPSLTSSNSTMTRESAVPQAPFFPPGPQPRTYLASRGAERPASFTSTAFGRRRSSLASLHRLISTSHGERSKLSIEVQLDNTNTGSGVDPEKGVKASKTKRLSRMMQFWRAKDEVTP